MNIQTSSTLRLRRAKILATVGPASRSPTRSLSAVTAHSCDVSAVHASG